MNEWVLVNENVYGPRGAHLVLQNIDFERISDLDLNLEVVLYLSKGKIMSDSFTAKYEGQILGEGSNVGLKPPTYVWNIPTDKQRKLLDEGAVPLSSLTDLPTNLEFVISSYKDDGIIRFRDYVIPPLFRKGYLKNFHHTSVFWFYAYGKGSNNKDVLLSIDSRSGLKLHKTNAGSVVVFTKKDLEMLGNLTVK